ncbi:protease inhibitor I42 family protein [Methanolobus sp.]|uniref:protease inhibitor I42 family protein n=1 Tax=Methanolobus sp. TaxID=1874737 RepID=UPI0025DD2ACD|nr:protease inhibitor I42 family protein [Methanolobus sp.]
MKKTLGILLIIGIVAIAVLTSGCMDNNSGIEDNGDADVPEGQDAPANDFPALEPITSVYIEDNNTEIVRALKGDTIIIELQENPTTGYSWNLSASSGLSLVNDTYVQHSADEGLTGVGGVHVWTFDLIENGVQNISAVYKRPWEDITGEEDAFELTVNVVPLENMIMATGTVIYVDLEGGFYGIAGEDNTNYDPMNLEEEFMEDGLEVEFTAYPVEDMMSIRMWGQLVEIRSMQSAA